MYPLPRVSTSRVRDRSLDIAVPVCEWRLNHDLRLQPTTIAVVHGMVCSVKGDDNDDNLRYTYFLVLAKAKVVAVIAQRVRAKRHQDAVLRGHSEPPARARYRT